MRFFNDVRLRNLSSPLAKTTFLASAAVVIREAFDNVRFFNRLRNLSSPLAKTTFLGLARLGHLHRLARSSLALWHHFCLLGGGDLRYSRQGAHP